MDYYVNKLIRYHSENKLAYIRVAEKLNISRSFLSKVIHGVKELPDKYHSDLDKIFKEIDAGADYVTKEDK